MYNKSQLNIVLTYCPYLLFGGAVVQEITGFNISVNNIKFMHAPESDQQIFYIFSDFVYTECQNIVL